MAYVQANIIPEVFSELTMEKLNKNLLLGGITTELDLPDFREQGDTVTIPMWLNDGSAIDLVKGNPIPVSEMKQQSTTAPVLHKAFGRQIFDAVDLTILGRSIDAVQQNMASVFAQAIETEIYKECLASAIKSPVADVNAITNAELLNALDIFGDQRNVSSFAGIYINSLTAHSFYTMTDDFFVRADRTFNQGTSNGIVENNIIGYFVGIPVFLSDVLFDASECTTLIIKKDSLVRMTKRDLNIEAERQAEYKATSVYGDILFAVKNVNPEGIVVCRKTVV